MRCDGQSRNMNNHLLKVHRSKMWEMQPLRTDMQSPHRILEHTAGLGTVGRPSRGSVEALN